MEFKAFNRLALLTMASCFAWNSSLLAKSDVAVISKLQIAYHNSRQTTIIDNDLVEQDSYSKNAEILPGIGLAGYIYLTNNGKDTIKLAEPNLSIVRYLNLKYARYGDSIANAKIFNTHLFPVTNKLAPKSQWNLANGDILPPKAQTEIDVMPSWEEISALQLENVDFFWVFDNSEAAKSDSSVTVVQYTGPALSVRIVAAPENNADSIYYLNEKAMGFDREQKYLEVYNTSVQVLSLDSLNITALINASEALWKLNRFDDALSYANKRLRLLKAIADDYQAKGAFWGYQDASRIVNKFEFIIDKCQKREAWEGNK